MKEKFIIEIIDFHSSKKYFNGIIDNQIQIVFGLENARKMNLANSICNYDLCKNLDISGCLRFEIKEI